MFKITETDKGIELDLNNSEEHARTGVMLRAFTHTFSVDEWEKFTDEIIERAKAEVQPVPEPEPEVEEDLREDLKGQSDQIHDLLEELGSMTYAEIGIEINVSPKRAARLISQMVRDGVKLKREGKPRKVSIG